MTIHHIVPWSKVRKHEFPNLIILCGTCHRLADAGKISPAELLALKAALHQQPPSTSDSSTPAPIFNVTQTSTGNGSTNIVAGELHFKARGRRKAPSVRIVGTVCDDPEAVGYLQYLARRYEAFKAWEVGKTAMRYGFIHSAYKRDLRYAVKTTPMTLFGLGVDYLTDRIRKTKLGRILNQRDNALARSFEEFRTTGPEPDDDVPPFGVAPT